jgi:hypothetical protein
VPEREAMSRFRGVMRVRGAGRGGERGVPERDGRAGCQYVLRWRGAGAWAEGEAKAMYRTVIHGR